MRVRDQDKVALTMGAALGGAGLLACTAGYGARQWGKEVSLVRPEASLDVQEDVGPPDGGLLDGATVRLRPPDAHSHS